MRLGLGGLTVKDRRLLLLQLEDALLDRATWETSRDGVDRMPLLREWLALAAAKDVRRRARRTGRRFC